MRERVHRSARTAAGCATLLALLAAAGAPAAAQTTYDYTSGSGGADFQTKPGFLLMIEGMLMNPRNADNVVVTETSLSGNEVKQIIPSWDDEFSGRLGLGYLWRNGAKITGTIWSFSTDVTSQGNASFGREYAFPIGPPISPSMGRTGTAYSATTELEAGTADVAFGQVHTATEAFTVEWSAGLRYANFEETHTALYDGQYVGNKLLESEMIGVRGGFRADYRWGLFSLNAGLGVSFLDGEVKGTSGLTDTSGVVLSGSQITDDGRSGTIMDFELNAVWHSRNDLVRVLLGWEQQVWDDLVADLVRNFPTTAAPLRDRDSITFSGLKLGLHFTF